MKRAFTIIIETNDTNIAAIEEDIHAAVLRFFDVKSVRACPVPRPSLSESSAPGDQSVTDQNKNQNQKPKP